MKIFRLNNFEMNIQSGVLFQNYSMALILRYLTKHWIGNYDINALTMVAICDSDNSQLDRFIFLKNRFLAIADAMSTAVSSDNLL